MASGGAITSPREGFTAHRMRTSGELQLTRMPQDGSCARTARVQPASLLFSGITSIETKRCWRWQARKEAVRS